ncbi:MAG: DnaB-like helicase C-terminal domain-containing protein [Bacteroidota bacterium]
MRRAITVEQLIDTKFDTMQFEGLWEASFGIPERSGVWIIWGHSGNGKTRFAMQLAKYLTNFGKVLYNTLEEGARKSMQRVVTDENMKQVSSRFLVLHREPIEELKERLRKRKSAEIIIIDSYQYTDLTKRQYIELKEEFDKKLFIFISHAEGKHPEGRAAKFVRYDADIKIRIEGYKAFPVSRYGGGKPYTIWHDGAEKYWGNKEFN